MTPRPALVKFSPKTPTNGRDMLVNHRWRAPSYEIIAYEKQQAHIIDITNPGEEEIRNDVEWRKSIE
jgi:hypothetical protein